MKTKKIFDLRLWLVFFVVSMLSNVIFFLALGIFSHYSYDKEQTIDLLLWFIAVMLASSSVLSFILTIGGLYFNKLSIDEEKCENCTNNCVENN